MNYIVQSCSELANTETKAKSEQPLKSTRGKNGAGKYGRPSKLKSRDLVPTGLDKCHYEKCSKEQDLHRLIKRKENE